MKKQWGYLLASLVLVAVAIVGLQLRQPAAAPDVTPISGSETVEPKNTPVGEYYIQLPGRTILLGDISGNNKIDTTDARMILQIAVGKFGEEGNLGPEDLLQFEFTSSDVDQNDTINTTDARLVLQAAANKITEFPDRVTTTTTKATTTPTSVMTQRPTRPSEMVEDLTKATNAVVNDEVNTFCNPINIAYGYQDSDNAFREGADPVVQVFGGEYYLFVSHNHGYWWSPDLSSWTFIPCMDAEMDKWAPATCVVDGTMYLTHSQGGAIFKSTDPKSGVWEPVGKPVDWGDPAFYYDEDGFVYCYYGCANDAPLYVVKLDPNNNMELVDGPFECFYQNREAHGFENRGNNNEDLLSPCWIEGAWVVKYEGQYYFNYAVPGTEFSSYANGCYVADKPIGPFTFCESSPFSFKPGGFLTGAGHGAVFEDLWGNWWCVETVTISINDSMERRIELLPVTFDENNNMIADTKLADYPTYLPVVLAPHSGEDAQPDWNLLSYGAAMSASSTLDAAYSADKAADESIRSWWSASSANADEWLQMDLGKLCAVNAVQLNFADQNTASDISGRDNTDCYNYIIEFSQDGQTWYTLADHTGVTAKPFEAKDTSHDYYELKNVIGARYLRVTNKGAIPAGGTFAISGLRVFGDGQGTAPAAVNDFTVNRPASDERQVTLVWTAADGAEGYVVRWGYAEDMLGQTYQVIGKNTVTIRALNMGVDYWFAIDSYNDSGYTAGTVVKGAAATKEAPAGTPVAPPVKKEYIKEGYTVYEAEAGKLGNGAVKSSGAEDAKASGGASVHNMHLADSYFEIANVDGGQGGAATLHLGYANGNASALIEVFVNGVSQGKTSLSTSSSWNRFVSQDIALTGLKAGEVNTIKVVGGFSAGFNPDFIQVIYEK